MTTTITIQADYKGFRIDYIFPPYCFQACIGSESYAQALTLPDLLLKLDAHVKHKRRFKELQVIEIDDDRVVEITSRDIQMPDKCVWVTSKTETGQPHHNKQFLKQYGWGKYDGKDYVFALASPANLKILAEIQALQAQIEEIHKTIKSLGDKYSDPITPDFLNRLDEEKETTKKEG